VYGVCAHKRIKRRFGIPSRVAGWRGARIHKRFGPIRADLRLDGPETLERFSAEPRELLWYYEGVRKATDPDLPDSLRSQLDHGIAEFRELVESFA